MTATSEGLGSALRFRRYVALGDSLSAGAEGDPSEPWPERAAELLAGDGSPLAFSNFAVAGATSTDVAIWQMQKAVEFRPDLISLICGANDVLLSVRPDPEVFTAVFDGILDSLCRRLPDACIVTATYPRIASLLPLRERTGRRIEMGIDAVNAAIRTVAARHQVTCLEWSTHAGVNDPANFAADQFHPSLAGHRRAATAFVEGLCETLGVRIPGAEEQL